MKNHLVAFILGFLLSAGGAFASAKGITLPSIGTVQDEGSDLTRRTTLNFAGAGVSCVDDTTRTTCTIAGGSTSPLTTKGDLYTYSTTNDRLAAGIDGLCLKTNSAAATGLEWNTCSATSAYSTVQEEGVSLTQRPTLNFIGGSVTCVDNAGSTRTDCTITSGGGGITFAEAAAADLAGAY